MALKVIHKHDTDRCWMKLVDGREVYECSVCFMEDEGKDIEYCENIWIDKEVVRELISEFLTLDPFHELLKEAMRNGTEGS